MVFFYQVITACLAGIISCAATPEGHAGGRARARRDEPRDGRHARGRQPRGARRADAAAAAARRGDGLGVSASAPTEVAAVTGLRFQDLRK